MRKIGHVLVLAFMFYLPLFARNNALTFDGSTYTNITSNRPDTISNNPWTHLTMTWKK